VEPTVNPGSNPALVAISCVSPNFCEAVGSYDNPATGYANLAEVWNGSAWSLQPIPTPPGGGPAQLTGVTCNATSACNAVGYVQDYTTGVIFVTDAETWDGTSWSTVPTQDPVASTGSRLLGVSCAPGCMAVGEGNGVTLALLGP
jgi:hypothetical protein